MNYFPMGLKGLAVEASTVLNRAVQFTGEQLGHAGERTELDGYLENLLSRAEQIRFWTEKLIACAESVIQPNPGSRVEDFLIEKLLTVNSESCRASDRLRNLENLGSCMLTAGQELTQADDGPNYGSALVRCGKTQLKIGQYEREFANKAERDFVKPLKRFLDQDAKVLARERRVLEAKRLDFDVARGKYKRTQSQALTKTPGTGQQFSGLMQAGRVGQDQERLVVTRQLGQTEAVLEATRREFDKQVELVTRLCNKIIQSSEQHARCLSKFIEAQAEYYQQSSGRLEDLLNGRPAEGDTRTGFASLAALSDSTELDEEAGAHAS